MTETDDDLDELGGDFDLAALIDDVEDLRSALLSWPSFREHLAGLERTRRRPAAKPVNLSALQAEQRARDRLNHEAEGPPLKVGERWLWPTGAYSGGAGCGAIGPYKKPPRDRNTTQGEWDGWRLTLRNRRDYWRASLRDAETDLAELRRNLAGSRMTPGQRDQLARLEAEVDRRRAKATAAAELALEFPR